MSAVTADPHNKAPDLKALLRERNMRLAHVAERMGVDRSALTRWTKTRVPAERVLELSQITGLPASALRPDLTFLDRRMPVPAVHCEIVPPSAVAGDGT